MALTKHLCEQLVVHQHLSKSIVFVSLVLGGKLIELRSVSA
jgi:hypothetical protein